MCFLHIVFCTVCKYVLSICKLFFYFALSGARFFLFVTIKVIWFDYVSMTKTTYKEAISPWDRIDLLARGNQETYSLFYFLSFSFLFCSFLFSFLYKNWKYFPSRGNKLKGWKIILIPLGIANSKRFVCMFIYHLYEYVHIDVYTVCIYIYIYMYIYIYIYIVLFKVSGW